MHVEMAKLFEGQPGLVAIYGQEVCFSFSGFCQQEYG
jgi:hypothetical protein